MASIVVNVRTIKKCAFCRHWYDPTNSAIEPRAPQIGLWTIRDTNQKNKCLLKNLSMSAGAFCGKYESKL